MDLANIRNFSIIAHIDHGKSTLSDRILEITGAVQSRDMRAQYLDSMDLERERGITIKAQNVRVPWKDNWLHLIDTPGHVDFGYEVSRSLAACEGVVLVVDAAQGIEAQTLANCYLALESNLEIVAVLNKIDLPAADPDRYAMEIEKVLGIPAEDILRISAKTGVGVPELLDAVVERIPAPKGDAQAPLQALIFDSQYDTYRGVVSSVRVMNGRMSSGSKLLFMQTKATHEVLEIGARMPTPTPVAELGPGEVGYLIAGIKDVGEARSGETVTTYADPATEPLDGYLDPKPMVFCGLFPIDGDDFENLRESLQRLKLNDASITYEPESSGALGFGFRCGFLGLLHMEIVKERLEREFNLALIATAPSVEYMVHKTDGQVLKVDNPADLPLTNYIASIEEPFFRVSIITPKEYTGSLMELCQERRGELIKLEYLSPERVDMQYSMPLAEVVVDFFDQLKSRSQGYASLDYELAGYRPSDLVRVDILLNALPADAFSTIVHRDKAYNYGNRMCGKLRELIPRQMFDVPIQAAIGGRIIARETVKAKRKDVLAKCYGGDISRKRKLLEKQKEGKKKMKSIGRVEVPGDVFISALKLDD
ncbi:MAG: translation elongation factor 4 [Actinobacteria bacterium]|jgi:GTP-binding protein LepA|nr:MAG: GTP-binding protein LepA [Acidimicrobium sp. BACL17 MAG-120823-bin42]MDA0191812.1 translation elongation factor 4 [Actinomycetota bacterium]MDA2952149.1 translation elongation factor 4 [Actinomycetota bacterium]MDA2998818.1 translation elongation factor 4 [Actinomycetota bacterium]